MESIKLGELYATNAMEREREETYGFRDFCNQCLLRHRDRDWGDLSDEDKATNDFAADHDERILSAYKIPRRFCIGYADEIWIITERNRKLTTILFPYEY